MTSVFTNPHRDPRFLPFSRHYIHLLPSYRLCPFQPKHILSLDCQRYSLIRQHILDTNPVYLSCFILCIKLNKKDNLKFETKRTLGSIVQRLERAIRSQGGNVTCAVWHCWSIQRLDERHSHVARWDTFLTYQSVVRRVTLEYIFA